MNQASFAGRQRRVFVDTSAYVALAVSDDAHHEAALTILNQLTEQRTRLYTTNFVVAETHAFFLRFLGHQAARSYLRRMEKKGATVVVRVRAADEEQAKAIIYRYTDKAFSLVDALSFVVMQRLSISAAFAFDQHFTQYGWEVLQPKG